MRRRTKTAFSKQKRLFAKTAANESLHSVNCRPKPQKTGFRM